MYNFLHVILCVKAIFFKRTDNNLGPQGALACIEYYIEHFAYYILI